MTRIAFVSCAHIEKRPVQPAWGDIAASQPDLLLLLGDNTYMNWVDGASWDPGRLKRNYAAQFKLPGFMQLIDQVPATLAVWDDHDLGPNDSCGGEMLAAQVAESRAYFDHYLGFARNNNAPHMYCTYDIGEVRLVMLDVRTYRTQSGKSHSTVLGPAQEEWLWQQLADNPKPYTVVGSGSVIDRGAAGQRLTDYPAFWQRLQKELGYVAPDPKASPSSKPRKVLFLSGDIHDNRWRRWNGFYEATSSGVACVVHESEMDTDNWGLLSFGANEVKIEFHGHAPSYVGVHRVRLHDWTEIQ